MDDRGFRKQVIDMLGKYYGVDADGNIHGCEYCRKSCLFYNDKDCEQTSWNYFNTHIKVEWRKRKNDKVF